MPAVFNPTGSPFCSPPRSRGELEGGPLIGESPLLPVTFHCYLQPRLRLPCTHPARPLITIRAITLYP